MFLLQCDWAASPCSGREQQGTVTGGPSSGQPQVWAPHIPQPCGLRPCSLLWLCPILRWCHWFSTSSHLQRLSPVHLLVNL